MAAARLRLLSCAALVILLLVLPSHAAAAGTADGSEEWGYVQVRPKAHMFWWLYRSPHRVDNGTAPWPTLLWLQGGPGASGAGYGNFMEIGPLDTDLKPRATTWLNKADLLFVDNPVGTGFSFVEGGKKSLLARTDAQAARDLTALLIKLYRHNKRLQGSPLYIVGESYGGKFAVTTALAALKAIRHGHLNAKLGGVALGDSWISPEDSVLSWGPLLYQLSRIDENGLQQCDSCMPAVRAQLQLHAVGAQRTRVLCTQTCARAASRARQGPAAPRHQAQKIRRREPTAGASPPGKILPGRLAVPTSLTSGKILSLSKLATPGQLPVCLLAVVSLGACRALTA